MRQNIDIAFKLLKVILDGKPRSSKSVSQPRSAREKNYCHRAYGYKLEFQVSNYETY